MKLLHTSDEREVYAHATHIQVSPDFWSCQFSTFEKMETSRTHPDTHQSTIIFTFVQILPLDKMQKRGEKEAP